MERTTYTMLSRVKTNAWRKATKVPSPRAATGKPTSNPIQKQPRPPDLRPSPQAHAPGTGPRVKLQTQVLEGGPGGGPGRWSWGMVLGVVLGVAPGGCS